MDITPEPNVIEQLRERMKQRNLADVTDHLPRNGRDAGRLSDRRRA